MSVPDSEGEEPTPTDTAGQLEHDEYEGTVDDDGEKTVDEEEEEEEPAHKTTKGKNTPVDQPHCNINFVINTPYKLLVTGSDTKIFAETTLLDPSPLVPTSRKLGVNNGDYVLLRGKDMAFKSSYKTTSFDPEDEYILQSNWSQFDSEMSGAYLADLGDVTFLLWWENVMPPKVATKKRAAAQTATVAKKTRKR